jgi:hypothetical protein
VTDELLLQYKLQPAIQMPHKIGASLPEKELNQLLESAERVGALLQNRHKGFLVNKRQQRAAGAYVYMMHSRCSATY